MDDKNTVSDEEKKIAEMLDLLDLLEPEINELNVLIYDMAKIKSAFQDEFKYLRMMANMNKVKSNNNEHVDKALGLIKELNGLTSLIDKLAEDSEEQTLYVENGFLAQLEDIRDRISAKLVPT